MHKIMGGLILLAIFILIFGPLAAGIYFQKNYPNLLSFYNSQNNLHIEIINYQRGWMSSDVTLSVTMDDPDYQFLVKQHVQHGPILYSNIKNISTLIGLVAIKNEIKTSHAIALKSDEDFVSLTGKYCNHLEIANLKMKNPEAHLSVKLNNLISDICIKPNKKQIEGELVLSDFIANDPDTSLEIKKIIIQLDQYQDQSGLWLGDNHISVPEVILSDEDKKSIVINGIQLSGTTNEKNGMVSGIHNLAIDQITIDKKIVGPINLQLSADKLNAKTLYKIIDIYKTIAENGEDYQGQLREQLSMTLPNILYPGTYIKLDHLDFTMSNNKAQMNGIILWPTDNFFIPLDLHDLVMSVQVQLQLIIPKEFMNEVIGMMSTMPSVLKQVAEPDAHLLFDTRRQMTLILQQNKILITDLVYDQILSEDEADSLIDLQKDLVSTSEYRDAVKKLLFAKKINMLTAYELNWQYDRLLEPYQLLQHKAQDYKKSAYSQLQAQFHALLKQGYFAEQDNNYTVLLQWSNGKLTANGQSVQ